MLPKCSPSSAAALSPMLRMPRPKISLSRLLRFEPSIACKRFCALFFLNLSSVSSCSSVRVYRSATVETSPLSMSCTATASPRPSMAMALRDAKWMRLRRLCAGHSGLTQRRAVSSCKCTTGAPQLGQVVGMAKGLLPGRRADTPMTSGMMSPALRTLMVSPMPTPKFAIISPLCRLARETLVPARKIGSNTAVGVSTPVRPTVTSILRTTLSLTSGGYLNAMAHRGNLFVLPRVRRAARSLTLMTAPSMSNSSVPRAPPMASISLIASSIFSNTLYRGETGKPSDLI